MTFTICICWSEEPHEGYKSTREKRDESAGELSLSGFLGHMPGWAPLISVIVKNRGAAGSHLASSVGWPLDNREQLFVIRFERLLFFDQVCRTTGT